MGIASVTSPVVAFAFRLFLRQPFVHVARWPLLRNDKDAPSIKLVFSLKVPAFSVCSEAVARYPILLTSRTWGILHYRWFTFPRFAFPVTNHRGILIFLLCIITGGYWSILSGCVLGMTPGMVLAVHCQVE